MLSNDQFTAYAEPYMDIVYRVALYDLKSPSHAEDARSFLPCTVVMEDGSRTELLPYAKLYLQMRCKSEHPIVLDDVDYILVGEETILYAQDVLEG